MFEVGTLLAGKYRIDRIIGQGGMGMVVAATHIHLGQPVALKFLLPELLRDRGVVERFAREARASAQLRGEHVCRVSDVGALDNGAPYIVMELLSGRDLASMVVANGPMPINIACDYVLQALLGLAEAHSLRIVHRDLKPANLFLTRRPEGTPLIKVLDFGIAKAQTETNFSLTRTSSVMGSPGYMSPEQLRSSKDVDVRSDVWAMGIILYELVSGRVPFSGESITELALRVGMDPTPLIPIVTPHGFDAIIYRCLEKDPARRFPDVAALAFALMPYASPASREIAMNVGRVLNVAPHAPDVQTALAAATPTTLGSSAGAITGATSTPAKRGGFPWIALGAAAVVAVVAMVALVKVRGGNHAAGQPSSDPPAAEQAPVVMKPETSPAVKAADPAPVEAKPAEAKPIEAKPVEAKPVEAKPVEAKPVEAKPVEVKPAARPEAKPVEAKPVAAKPVEAKPAAARPADGKPMTKPKSKTKPPAPTQPGDFGDSRF